MHAVKLLQKCLRSALGPMRARRREALLRKGSEAIINFLRPLFPLPLFFLIMDFKERPHP